MKHKLLILTLFSIGIAVPQSWGATDGEWEQSKAVAAVRYLRYANNGADYLDKAEVKTLGDLEKMLSKGNRKTEIENLKAFKALQLAQPSEYQKWDSKALADYWYKKIYNECQGSLKNSYGAAANDIKNRISKMQVTMNAAATGASTPEPTAPEGTAPDIPAELTSGEAADAEAALLEQDAVADSLAAAAAVEEDTVLDAEDRQKTRNSGRAITWVYVALLAAIVGVAVWLILYASKVFKGKPRKEAEEDPEYAEGEDADEPEQRESPVRPARSERVAAEEDYDLEDYRSECDHLRRENNAQKAEITTLKKQIAQLQLQLGEALGRVGKPAVAEGTAAAGLGEGRSRELVVYLGRVNANGIFVRCEAEYNPEASLYRMVSADGYSGSFQLISTPEAVQLAFSNPERMLGGGCLIHDIDNTAGYDGFETVSAGTAVYEGGRWKVIRKARVKYVKD